MTVIDVGYQWRSNRFSRLAVVVTLVAAIFIVAPPAQGADVFSVAFASPASSQIEGDTGSVDKPVTVTLATASDLTAQATVLVTVTGGSATVVTDYTGPSPASATFPIGSTDGATTTVDISVKGDTTDELDETVVLGFGTPSAGGTVVGQSSHSLEITDNDTATISINDAVAVFEGGVSSFKVTLSTSSSRTVSVNYATANGTAVSPADFTAINPPQTLTFLPGQTTKDVNVTTKQDLLNEGSPELFTVILTLPTQATIIDNSGSGSILDDDVAPGLSVLDAVPVAEGPAAKLKFTVKLSPASGKTVTVKYATANGTAVSPADYTAITPPQTLTFLPGQTTKDLLVSITNDTIDEIAETVMLNLTLPTNTTIADAQGVGAILDNDNVAPVVKLMQTTDSAGTPGFEFTTGQTVKLKEDFTDPGLKDTHTVTIDWGDGTAPAAFVITPVGARSFERTHKYAAEGFFQISASVADADGGNVVGTAFVTVHAGGGGLAGDTVGLVDPTSGQWRLYDGAGEMVTEFYYGNPGDYPFIGDWDGDGIETPGLYRQSDGFAYLRNLNTQGIADIRFFFGDPGDIPIAGDFNGDGLDTLSIYRPSNQTFYIINTLGTNGGGLGAAEFSYVFGNPGDKPFVGDFDGDGIETVGLHRESTGLVYFRNSHTQGNADHQFIYGDPGDQIVAGDWTAGGIDSPALYRSSTQTFYFRFTNTQGNADATFYIGVPGWIPVAGMTGA
jgi:hypothetical protein